MNDCDEDIYEIIEKDDVEGWKRYVNISPVVKLSTCVIHLLRKCAYTIIEYILDHPDTLLWFKLIWGSWGIVDEVKNPRNCPLKLYEKMVQIVFNPLIYIDTARTLEKTVDSLIINTIDNSDDEYIFHTYARILWKYGAKDPELPDEFEWMEDSDKVIIKRRTMMFRWARVLLKMVHKTPIYNLFG